MFILWIIMYTLYTVSGRKRNRQYFGRNFDKFRQLFIFLDSNHPDNLCDWTIVRCSINICTTLRNDDVNVTWLKNAVFARRETTEFILPLPWPPNSPDLNPVDLSVWEILQDKVYKTCMTDLDVKHRIRTDWAKLVHAVIAASVHQWRRRLSGCTRQGRRQSFRALSVVDQSNNCTLIGRFGSIAVVSYDFVFCMAIDWFAR